MIPGERIDHYELVSHIGAGGMGDVWKALDTRLGRAVALKFSRDEFSQRFRREARAIAALNHPNICTLYDIGPNYLVMEYIEGYTPLGPLPAEDALRLALGIAGALEAAHERGIIHRDLKPANVMVTRSGVKLLDFGLAQVGAETSDDTMSAITGTGNMVGTVSYMSPEQFQGSPADARSDIFAFGLVLYELLSGRRAFAGTSPLAVMNAVVHEEPAPLQAPPELVGIVRRCLRKKPVDRFQSVSELRDAIAGRAEAEIPRAVAEPSPSIAVLPFANIGGDPENEYFSDGLAEEILNSLAQLSGLRVVARASAFAFRGRDHSLREIGEKLKVGYVLQGSVRRAGNRMRAAVQLIAVADDSQLWAQRFDREMRDVFEIQDEIAQAVVEMLRVRLGSQSGTRLVRRRTTNPEALDLYLKGTYFINRASYEDYAEKGRRFFEQALEVDPGYGPALNGLAEIHCFAASSYAPPLSEFPKAIALLERALASDENDSDAQAGMAYCEALYGYRWDKALERFATGAPPNSTFRTRVWRTVVLNGLGRAEDALEELNHALRIDPFNSTVRIFIARQYFYLNRPDLTEAYARQVLDQDADAVFARCILAEACSFQHRHEEALDLLRGDQMHSPSLQPEYWLCGALARAGRIDEAAAIYRQFVDERPSRFVPAVSLALLASGLGDLTAAFDWLHAAVDERDPNLALLRVSPLAAPLRIDARGRAVLRRMNLG